LTAPPPGTPFVTRERVAAAVAALLAADDPITCTTVRMALGGGSDRDVHRHLHELGYSTPAQPTKHPVEVPPAIAQRILITIVALAAANFPLLHRAICARARARGEYVTAVRADYLATYGAPAPASFAEEGSDEETLFIILEEEPQGPSTGSVTEDIANGGSVTSNSTESGSVTKSVSSIASYASASERSAQGTLIEATGRGDSASTQVTSQCDCKIKHTPPACGRRGDPPTSTPASVPVVEEGC
jgi:hypothetical protein